MLRDILATLGSLVSRTLLIDAAILGVITAILLVQASWSPLTLSTWLFWAGAITVILAGTILTGGFEGRASFDYQYGRSAGPTDLPDRTAQDVRTMATRYGDVYILGLAGAVAIGLSFLVGSFA